MLPINNGSNLMPYFTRMIKVDRVGGFEPTTAAKQLGGSLHLMMNNDVC